MLLFDAATDARGYEEAVSECEHGLNIEAPSDPEPHSLRLPGPTSTMSNPSSAT
jgi:hypothetical protein